MKILYVVGKSSDIQKQEYSRQDTIYILDLEKSEVVNYNNNECIIGRSLSENPEVNLGEQFLLGYKGMLALKGLFETVSIDRIELYCKYIDAYFILQYILYSGCIINQVEILAKQCQFTQIEENPYRFPSYWVKNLENECVQFLNTNKEGCNISKYPLLSIIIPYYNLGEYITETIESIQKCNYPHYEIIIVNDGSSDLNSLDVLNQLRKDATIRVIDQENAGLSAARNAGALAAKGEYIAFLDADDLVDKTYYRQCVNILEEHKDVDIVYSWVEFFGGKHEIWPTFNLRLPYLLLSNMASAFYVIRKEKFLKFGMNKVYMRKGMEDYDSLISMHKNGCKGVAIPEALSKYRYRLDSMSKAFNPDLIVEIYNQIVEEHNDIYKQYSQEIIKLINANGPGYLWNNPTLRYPSVALNVNEDINDVKYILIRLLNTKLGRLGVKILKNYKKKKENR